MKRTLLVYLFHLLIIAVSAQSSNTVLYGVLQDNHTPWTITFARVDALTGTIINENTVQNPNVMVYGTSAFMSGSDAAYMIQGGVGLSNNYRLYNIDADSLVVQSNYAQPIILNDPVYDMQKQLLVGLKQQNSSNPGFRELVFQDPLTGQDSVIAVINGIQGFVAGAATYDSDNGIYYINGIDFSGVDKLIRVNVNTGVVQRLNLNMTRNQHLTNLEYDDNLGVLYGIYRDNGTAYIAEIDTQSALITPRVNLSGKVNQFAQNASVFDHQNSRFILYSYGGNGSGKIVSIDMIQDSIIAQAPITGFLQELEYDNSSFAVAKYGTIPDQEEEEETTIPVDVTLYPNPVSDQLSVSIELPSLVQIIDVQGKIVMSKQLTQPTLNVSALPEGMYWLSIEHENKRWVQSFVKQ